MTRRDYVFLAECFNLTLTSEAILFGERVGVARAARDMAYKLALANPRFDQALFLRNCGLVPSTTEGCPNYGGT